MSLSLASGCHDDIDLSGTPPEEAQLRGWGDLLEELLGSTDKQEFTFPYILRRVETLSVLSANGERRQLSLDVDTATARKRVARHIHKHQTSAAAPVDHEGSSPELTQYGDLVPLPFAVFSKGILLDFSAKADGQALALERKNTCWVAGFAWLMNALPDGTTISADLRARLWWICRHHPSKPERDQLAPGLAQALTNNTLNGLNADTAGTNAELPLGPAYWSRVEADDPLIRKPAPSDEFRELLFNPDDGQPTKFQYRLQLLSLNYFPLVLVPLTDSSPSRLLLKFDFLYGDSEEEWFRRKLAALRKESWLRRYVFPRGPWPWEVQLFGDLEGHCEHLRISLPSGVELAAGPYWPDDGALNWFRSGSAMKWAKQQWHRLANRLRGRNHPDVADTESDGPRIIEHLVISPEPLSPNQIRSATHHKFFRNVVTIRRHTSIRRGGVRIRFGIVPILNGVFAPLMIALSLVLISLAVPIGFWFVSGRFYNFGDNSAGLGVDIPLWLSVLSSVLAVAVNKLDEPLRIRMLSDVYVRTLVSVIFGALSLWAYTLVRLGEQYLFESSVVIAFWLVVASFLTAMYAWFYLLLSRIRIEISRRKMRSLLGHTRELPL